ncbi:hypothetical protein CLV98_1091 [Dyadobacter jejuensis]|uniref:Uncharacterized protein n=1 Tax=Dyadobacter jejuensis TaxID=1082580 RepID=A0A316AGW8_9BACT|nr:hypothetical protein CLV98_1091 [Dyadobacter jejuensis]
MHGQMDVERSNRARQIMDIDAMVAIVKMMGGRLKDDREQSNNRVNYNTPQN